MTNDSTCPECGRSNLYLSNEVSSGGGYAPNYLPPILAESYRKYE